MPGRPDRRREGEDRLVFLPLGGAGEIGMNLYLYGYGPPDDTKWLMVDLGIKFGDDRDPGIDVIFPDIAYIEAERAGHRDPPDQPPGQPGARGGSANAHQAQSHQAQSHQANSHQASPQASSNIESGVDTMS